MAEPSWTEHVAAGATWRRFGWMLLFAPVLACVGILVAFTALFQFFSMLASGETNPQLTGFGRELSALAAATMDYLTYNTERRPFPFSQRPQAAAPATGAPEPGASSGGRRRPRRAKTRARRKSAVGRGGEKKQTAAGPPPEDPDSAIGIGAGEAPRAEDDEPPR